MLTVESSRITDPASVSLISILEACERHGRLIVQFSRPETYHAELLASLNEACIAAKDALEVRFFGHYGAHFDASHLRHLPAVQNLSIDGIRNVIHESEIGSLAALKGLKLGVFEFDQPGFLDTLRLEQLERLELGETRKRNINLAPLAHCASLGELSLVGHARGIGAIASLPKLRKLTLSSQAASNEFEFISGIPDLRKLSLIFGSKKSIGRLSSATLEELQLVRVRGLVDLGDLSRFTMLRALRIEDQSQLTELDLIGVNLEKLLLENCKELAALRGLEAQGRLREIWISRVALDMDALWQRAWGPTTRLVTLGSSRKTWNEEAAADLEARGIRAAPFSWSW